MIDSQGNAEIEHLLDKRWGHLRKILAGCFTFLFHGKLTSEVLN